MVGSGEAHKPGVGDRVPVNIELKKGVKQTMKTNVIINDDLIKEALELTRLKTKSQVIETALSELVRIKKQQRILELEGKLKWEGNLEEMRQGRFIEHDDSN